MACCAHCDLSAPTTEGYFQMKAFWTSILRQLQIPHSDCAGSAQRTPNMTRIAAILVYVIVVVAVTAMVSAGFEPAAALGFLAACGIVASDVAARLLGSLSRSEPS